jgi:hypothetical protein
MKPVRHEYKLTYISFRHSPTHEQAWANQNAEKAFSRITLQNNLSRAQETQNVSNARSSLDPHAYRSSIPTTTSPARTPPRPVAQCRLSLAPFVRDLHLETISAAL